MNFTRMTSTFFLPSSCPFANEAYKVLHYAEKEATSRGNVAVYPCHIGVALVSLEFSRAKRAMKSMGIDVETWLDDTDEVAFHYMECAGPDVRHTSSCRPYSSSTKLLLNKARNYAKSQKRRSTDTGHMLYGLALLHTVKDPSAAKLAKRIGLEYQSSDEVISRVGAVLKNL